MKKLIKILKDIAISILMLTVVFFCSSHDWYSDL